jgi:hypothetical protein
MLYQLKRHPFPIETHFDQSLVLTYALPADFLATLLPPGLAVDRYGENGFIAVALVDARQLRPRGFPPFLGASFLLSGYRIFVRHRSADGAMRRGLHILRSDTNRRAMALGGNVFTHYRYDRSDMAFLSSPQQLQVTVTTRDHHADLDVVAHLDRGSLPTGSPFEGTNDARRFVGPLPWTLDYERQTDSIIAVRGHRSEWKPRQVEVEVRRATFFDQPKFAGVSIQLANAFYVADIPYHWDRGVRMPAQPVQASWQTESASDE